MPRIASQSLLTSICNVAQAESAIEINMEQFAVPRDLLIWKLFSCAEAWKQDGTAEANPEELHGQLCRVDELTDISLL